jgi:DNA-binding transcriptional ArsR family regulator
MAPGQPAPAGGRQPDRGPPGGQVREQPRRDERARHHGGAVHRDHAVLEVLPDRHGEIVPAGHRHLIPGQRAEHLCRGALAPVLADGHGHAGGAVTHDRQAVVVGEARLAVPLRPRQRDPQLQAVLTAAGATAILKCMLDQTADLDRVFQALADPGRRVMMERLSQGPASVSELARPLAMSLAAVLQHVQVLEASGLVRSHKSGRTRTCSIDPAALRPAEQWISARRALWERRLDRLGEYLEATPPESGHPGEH